MGNASANTERQSDSATPLHEASRHGHADSVACLLAAGARIDARTSPAGCTALHLACRAAHAGVAGSLIAAKTDPNAVNEAGQTPMGLAFEGSNRSREARGAFKGLREVLASGGAALGEYNPTLYPSGARPLRKVPTARRESQSLT